MRRRELRNLVSGEEAFVDVCVRKKARLKTELLDMKRSARQAAHSL
jgi:hypothetical protein